MRTENKSIYRPKHWPVTADKKKQSQKETLKTSKAKRLLNGRGIRRGAQNNDKSGKK